MTDSYENICIINYGNIKTILNDISGKLHFLNKKHSCKMLSSAFKIHIYTSILFEHHINMEIFNIYIGYK